MSEKQKLIDEYRNLKDVLIRHLKDKHNKIDSLNEYCALFGIPLIAAYTYLAEEDEELKGECNTIIKRLCEFYGMT